LKLENCKQVQNYEDTIKNIDKEKKTVLEETDYAEKKIEYQLKMVDEFIDKVKDAKVIMGGYLKYE